MKKIGKFFFAALMSLSMLFSLSVSTYAHNTDNYAAASAETAEKTEKKPNVLIIVLASVGGGALVALIYTGTLKAKLKSVHTANQAKNYIVNGSLNISVSRDIYLYRKVERREKQSNQQ